jgi:hypothetical protein
MREYELVIFLSKVTSVHLQIDKGLAQNFFINNSILQDFIGLEFY